MNRLAGAALLAVGCAALGLGAAARLAGRVQDLRGLVAGLEAMERELGWRQAPMAELLELAGQVSGGRAGIFFRLCAQGAAQLQGRTFRQVWHQAQRDKPLYLDGADRLLLEQLGAVLGRYDAGSQRQAIAAAVERLEEQRRQAQQRRQRLGRVYGMLGMAAGALVLILLI